MRTKFKAYITSSPFTTIVYTDHKPLIGILHNREPTNHRHLKWVSMISSLNLNIQYQEGRKNVLADALSRIPTSFETINIINNSINNVTDANINNYISSTNNINNLMNEYIKKRIFKIDGVEYLKQGEQLRRIVHNKEEKQKLIEEAHGLGHEGV